MDTTTENVVLLSAARASDVYDVIAECCEAPNVTPPGFEFSRDDAIELFAREGEPPADVPCVYGYVTEHGLGGVVSLQPLSLDGTECLEFMIFFRRHARGAGTARAMASEVINRIGCTDGRPIVTLVYHANESGRRFYASAGFCYDRQVKVEQWVMELWRYGPEPRTGCNPTTS